MTDKSSIEARIIARVSGKQDRPFIANVPHTSARNCNTQGDKGVHFYCLITGPFVGL